MLKLLADNDVQTEIQDERFSGHKLAVQFTGSLRKDQNAAITEMLRHDNGVLCAPTAFGKTVIAAALIGCRKVSTLVLVHRTELEAMEASLPRLLLATGRLIGEGFDHPPLDTLVLAMPISWKGTLQQYAGRLHRAHADKQDVRIYDYVEMDHPQLSRMWQKRQRGYLAMGYQVLEAALL